MRKNVIEKQKQAIIFKKLYDFNRVKDEEACKLQMMKNSYQNKKTFNTKHKRERLHLTEIIFRILVIFFLVVESTKKTRKINKTENSSRPRSFTR